MSVVPMMVVDKINLTLPHQFARFAVLLLLRRTLLGELAIEAEDELHWLLAALLITRCTGSFSGSWCSCGSVLLLSFRDTSRNDGLQIVLDPWQIIQFSAEVFDCGLLVEFLVISKLINQRECRS